MPGKGGYRQINKALNVNAFDDYLASQQSCLPKLLDVEQISPRVIRVLGQNAGKFTLQGTNTFIVGTGAKRLIIDTAQGIPEWADLIEDTLAEKSFSLSHIFLTHWHGDHTLGVPQLLGLYPYLRDSVYKNEPDQGQQPISDGQVFKVEGATIRAVHTPGHSHDHMCFVLEEENAMFTGDNILGHGSSAVEELSIYMTTLKKMKAQNCAVGYPAHGDVIDNLPAKISGELAQKMRRERQALKALGEAKRKGQDKGWEKIASLSAKEIVTAIHGHDLDEDIRAMALEPFMEEVLRKLAEDGKVGFQIKRGQKHWFAID